MTDRHSAPAAARYDTVVVGAGLAGLCAAHDLRDRTVVVLERAARAGGRVLTRRHGEIAYDLGALFAYQEQALRVPKPRTTVIREAGPVGLVVAGRLHLGGNVIECLRSSGLPAEQINALLEFRQTADDTALSPDTRARLAAFFHVIHPGELDEYIPERRTDALKTFPPHHHARGNGILVDQLAGELGDRLVAGADVRAVDDDGDRVLVRYELAGEQRTVTARSAIVCTPAPVTRGLLARANREAGYFLDSVEYRGGLVVVLAFSRPVEPAFSYLVTVDGQPNTVIRQDQPGASVLTCYYVGARRGALAEQAPAQVIEQTVEHLRALGLRLPGPEARLFADVHDWPRIGPVITERMRAYHHPRALRPSELVVLAGDYTDGAELPYGMAAAMRSGHRAAAETRALLDATTAATTAPAAAPAGPALADEAPLVDAYRYRWAGDRPVFLDRVAEGNVAFYGLVLQAEPDARLRDYLLRRRRDGLWEYHVGFGITAEDSALVIEGLWRAGVARDVLQPSLQCLVTRCFDPAAGAIHTIPLDRRGRAGYWHGPSLDATAHAGYLLHAIAPGAFDDEVGRCAEFLCAQQAADGRFTGRWFPSWVVTTYYAVRLLHARAALAACRRAHWALLRGQSADGSWRGSVIDTAAAVLALGVLDAGDPAIARGRAWLRSQEQAGGWLPEAVLYYWFETSAWGDRDAAQRVFFHAMDRGRITTAWARLALSAEQGECQ